ncbi:HWE histidine kinase domain-containing protein [Poseidonocella sedimentorum]|uniref:histidine kinase n=1 Tax=Poseidonocella sedimentorum TaxID=871652 RepID=A0A1I6DI97_9RHOB|nr:HWE histidine kinase domain-containing protein [Poseidonocella sedimentorum]SFR05163.1 Bacteriophytochrome (light-regulated signal transduction histidine kinase) [Poseidonocella sedimentorum]
MSEPRPDLDPPEVDLTNCDREPIHIPGRIQHYGCLVAISADWMIAHVSENCDEVLGRSAKDMLGMRFVEFFSEETVHFLRSRIQILALADSTARVYDYDLMGDGRRFDVSIHYAGRMLVFEFEPRGASDVRRDDLALVQPLIARVQRHNTLEKIAAEGARALKGLTGIDRVMVYRFEPDGSGVVIAEAVSPGLEPFLGLRYPASDIPKQARALYTRNLLRIIPDIRGETYRILPELGPEGAPVDLSKAVTRAVSPIHLEYLRNMGVQASMSVSILRKGELWGLFACHHYAPFHLDFQKRSAVELFVQLFNYELAQFEITQELAEVDKARGVHDRLMSQISSGESLFDLFDAVADELEPIIPHDGVAVYSGGDYRARGMAPTKEEFIPLARFLNTAEAAQVYATDNLAARFAGADVFAGRIAGVLALPISRTPRDYLVLFRREVARSVTWAGNPDKPASLGPNGVRLTPRKSFEAWQEIVRDHSSPWRPRELRAAEVLRVTLLEVVIKLADEASEKMRRAQDQQELLIAELNHRVRNILNLIRSLVTQTRGGADTLESYAALLDARIHALARAHDQLTKRDWAWVPLQTLISNEVNAFLSDRADRVVISGAHVDLSPSAFTTLALVVHELMTNSAKYGALSQSGGRVEIAIDLDPDGTALLNWRETGGPPVQPPTRKGFGTTIIERSVPFELNGTAEIRYRVAGVSAAFTIPGGHVEPGAPPAPEVVANVPERPSDPTPLTGSALVLEDNMIIAMDAADILTELGAQEVHTASKVSEAMELLERESIDFVLLDVNLGGETSQAVAERCAEAGIRAVLATGYGGDGEVVADFPDLEVLRKPYTADHLRYLLRGNG